MKKLLALNRSEIAIRILRAANELGLRTVAIYSQEDRLALHRFKADEAYLIGAGKGPVEAYLDVEGIVALAKEKGVDAIHPGYGFLAENPALPLACARASITFIGPSAGLLELLGDKTAARKLAQQAGVPVVPGTGKAVSNPHQAEKIAAGIGFPLIVRYAMTESPTISGTEPTDPPDVQFRTVGRPQKGMEVAVSAPAGEVGQIRIRGGCVMRGYWNAPELTRQAFDDEGWLVSGDLGYLREDGNLSIVGRGTDMYIRGGYNIYPAEVEAVLALHPEVASVSVVGSPAPRCPY